MLGTPKVGLIGWITLLLLLLLCGGVYGAPGDCNGDGSIDASDMALLLGYLGGGPPLVNYADCDCDGFPGVNIGDFYQMMAFIFYPPAAFFPWPGTDLIAPANTDIMVSGKVNGTTLTKMFIFINNPSALGGGLLLPFSFAAKPGEADLDCTDIIFGPLFPGFDYSIDNVGKTFQLHRLGTVAATANWEVLCEVEFAPQAGGSPGDSLTVDPTTTGRYFPLLVTTMAYNGTDFKRMLFPRFVPDTFGTIGDLNCDGMADISDAVYLIAYIFSGGNPPGDPDGDGTPNCPGL